MAQDLQCIECMNTDRLTQTDQALSQDNKLREFDPTQPYTNWITICDTLSDRLVAAEAKVMILELIEKVIPREYQNELVFTRAIQEMGQTVISWTYTPKEGSNA